MFARLMGHARSRIRCPDSAFNPEWRRGLRVISGTRLPAKREDTVSSPVAGNRRTERTRRGDKRSHATESAEFGASPRPSDGKKRATPMGKREIQIDTVRNPTLLKTGRQSMWLHLPPTCTRKCASYGLATWSGLAWLFIATACRAANIGTSPARCTRTTNGKYSGAPDELHAWNASATQGTSGAR